MRQDSSYLRERKKGETSTTYKEKSEIGGKEEKIAYIQKKLREKKKRVNKATNEEKEEGIRKR